MIKTINIVWCKYASAVNGYNDYRPTNKSDIDSNNPILSRFEIKEYTLSHSGCALSRYAEFDMAKDKIVWASTFDMKHFKSLAACKSYVEKLIIKYINELI